MDFQSLSDQLFKIQAVKFGSFTLKSGMNSPIYIDLRLLISYPALLRGIANMMWEQVKGARFDLVCGVPYTALPIATCMSIDHQVPMVMRRKEIKEYGTKKAIEGVFHKGQKCLVVEDLITTGSSVLETIAPLKHEGLHITDVVVLIDREQGGKEKLQSEGIAVHSILNLKEMLRTLKEQHHINNDTYENTLDFLEKGVVNVS